MNSPGSGMDVDPFEVPPRIAGRGEKARRREQHAKALADLKSKSGAAFDQAFLDHEIAYHQAVIDAVTKTLLPAIKNAALKAFVEKIAPAFRAHLDMCKAAKAQISMM